jgi:ABC-type glycerol-3-phosphate transport system permease component
MDLAITKQPAEKMKAGMKSAAHLGLLFRYIILIPVGFLYIFPFAWTVISSLKKPGEILIVPIQWFPKVAQWSNYTAIFTEMPFARSFGNSLLVSGAVTLSVIFFGSLAGFALAKYHFKGRQLYLTFILATMMVPSFIFLMPHYVMVYAFGWIDTYWALIIPNSITAFGIFFMRQFIQVTVPDELLDAARIDGCSEMRLFFTIVMPLCKSAYLVLGVITFITNWNDFLWPLIVTQNREMYTIQVLLATLQQAYGSMKFIPLLMAGTTIALIPGIILFILVQRQIVEGISMTGIK